MKLGTNDIGSVYLGTNAVQKVYLGTNEVWSALSGILLDDFPNAAAAYSLRKLRSAYTGDAIRVRRASDNTEQNIGFVNNELDTASLTSFCSGTNGFVTTWYDQSGNGYNATQTTAGNQPQIVSSGSVITENGNPSVKFDGTDDNLDANTLSTLFSGISKNYFFGLVAKSTNTVTGNKSAFSFGNSSTIGPFNWIGEGTSALNSVRIDIRADATGVQANNVDTGSISTQSLVTSGNNYSNVYLYKNSGLLGSSNNLLGQTTLNRFSIGCLSRTSKIIFWNGIIQEIIIYQSDESSNRTGISDNINDFYSIY
jgi:hypothetical protein